MNPITVLLILVACAALSIPIWLTIANVRKQKKFWEECYEDDEMNDDDNALDA